jgi:hypothetical protein
MSWQHVRISRFGGPEVLELAEESTIPNPGPARCASRFSQPGPVSRQLHSAWPLPWLQRTAAVHSGLRASGCCREGWLWGGLAARGANRCRSLRGRWLRAICNSSRTLSCACSRWRRCGRGRLHTARLPYSLPDAHALSSLIPGETILVVGASGTVGTATARSRASFWPQGNRYVLSGEPLCSWAMWSPSNRLSRRWLRCFGA